MPSDQHTDRTSHEEVVLTCSECDYHSDDHRKIRRHAEEKGHFITTAPREKVDAIERDADGWPLVATVSIIAGVGAIVSTMVLLGAWPYDTMRINPELFVVLTWFVAGAFIIVAYDAIEREKKLKGLILDAE